MFGRFNAAEVLAALVIGLVSASAVHAGDCIKYDLDGSYVDTQTKHTILRFYNTCNEARTLRIYYDGNYFSPVGGTVAGSGEVYIDTGIRTPGVKFWYTDDGSDPKPKDR